MPYVAVKVHSDGSTRESGEDGTAAWSCRHSLALGGVGKIVVACAASAGLVACALERKSSSARPSLRYSSTGAAVRLAEDQGLDCFDGTRDWRHAWSAPKKEYCCLQTHIGCPSDEAPETGTVDVLQLDQLTKFPVQVQTTSFDCNLGYKRWKKGWSEEKKTWCCLNYGMGCTEEEEQQQQRQQYTFGWLIAGIATLVVLCVGAILACIIRAKMKRDEELRSLS
mmetsp:Transcript_104979/g.328668  ORF Transcript_104979/g.328668 Transcript_104979/m.328668 type:complete len:224 (+) Transcript_104979:96-767(+)